MEARSPFAHDETARYVYERSKGTPVRIYSEEAPAAFHILLSWTPMLLLIAFWGWFAHVIKRSLDRLSEAVEKRAAQAR